MTIAEQKLFRSFINERLEVAFKRLDENPQFIEECRLQDKSGKVVEELLQKLDKADRIAIRRHYEGETAKESYALNEAYAQGLRDCIKFLTFINAFQSEMCL